jgi:hypothetical protein
VSARRAVRWLVAEAHAVTELLLAYRPTAAGDAAADVAPAVARLASYAAIVYLAVLRRGRALRRMPTASVAPPPPGAGDFSPQVSTK